MTGAGGDTALRRRNVGEPESLEQGEPREHRSWGQHWAPESLEQGEPREPGEHSTEHSTEHSSTGQAGVLLLHHHLGILLVEAGSPKS